jgi:acyl-coenzyme A thioesterase PaaI-like protein
VDVRTHQDIDPTLCGAPIAIADGTATVRFRATPQMAVDARGLVHGGFVFGLVDHAAMLAVLGSAEGRFLAPVRVGDEVLATATLTEVRGRKRVLQASARVGERLVFEGSLVAFVLDRHVLD